MTLTKPFYLAKYPVTQEQYEKLTGESPSSFRKGGEMEGALETAAVDAQRRIDRMRPGQSRRLARGFADEWEQGGVARFG